MAGTYRALVCCRAGIGSSMMLEAKCKQVIEEEGLPLETLSCGMSDDFEIAVEEGSTLVRLGRCVFDQGYALT